MTVMTRNATVKALDNGVIPELVNNIILVRGLPGSGKTTVANMINPNAHTFRAATDDWFINKDGKYKFNKADLVVNHAECQVWFENRVSKAQGNHTIIVHNTFTMFWELHPYISFVKGIMDDEDQFRITVIDIYDGGLTDELLARRNNHGVGKAVIERMRDRWVPWSWQGYEFYVEGIKSHGKRWA